jgi:hypothetical protein
MIMDGEEEAMAPPQMQARQMPPFMRAAALTMTGDLILVFGLLFILLGAAMFITDFLRIKGSGEIIVGLGLCAMAIALLAFSSRQLPKIQVVARPPAPQPPAKMTKADQSSYR